MIVLTIGTFDIPHMGHLRLLKRCAQFGEVHVGINTDDFVASYKGKPPIFKYQERVDSIAEWGFTNTYPNDQKDGTVKPVIEAAKPNIIAVGSDWLRKPYLEQIGLSVDYLEKNNISLLFLPYVTADKSNISTSEIKRRFK